ncbi:MAG: hypothetical protein M3162_07835 [Thermoproteota archaeon]|nr:hypothetical protein [Thermoproteota archaeon]
MTKYNTFSYFLTASFAVFLVFQVLGIESKVDATAQTNTTISTVNVQAGAGNASMSISAFSPQTVEVNVGDSVRWTNPTEVPEPHTVTFVLSNETHAELFSAFAVDNSTQFNPVPPNSNSEPSIVPQEPNGTKLVVALNDRAFNPYVIDSAGNIESLSPNANYTITGTEKYINSGTITPEGLTPPTWPPINEFTATFEKAGTYHYLCIYHPWMTGTVMVK